MAKLQEYAESFGRSIIPKRFRDPLQQYLLKAGFDRVPYSAFAGMFLVAVVITYILFLFVYPLLSSLAIYLLAVVTLAFWVLCLGALVALAMFFIWTYLNLTIYNRTKEMEDRLPDYLSLVVTNLRSGMSFDKSLWAAIRPEFGVLAREITMVSKKVMTGNDTADALTEFAKRYDSPILRRSMNLIISEIESGGEIASVIERVIENLRKTHQLKKEMAASVVSYMIFISIITMVLSPILFALANTILKVILGFAVQIAHSQSGSVSVGGAASVIKTFGKLSTVGDQLSRDFHTFSYIALGTVSIFAGMIVSIIEKGDIRGGVKYIPVFVSITMVLFYFASRILAAMFAGLL